jgi:YVTN family beta-propeller protein
LSVLGTNNTVLKTLPLPGLSEFPAAISPVYRRLYVANQSSNTLIVVDTDADRIARTVTVGSTPAQVAVDDGRMTIYVANAQSNTVSLLDARTEAVVATLPVDFPLRVATGAGRLLTLNSDSVTIASAGLDLDDGTSLATEWYHAGFDHYFHSADEVENRVLEDGFVGTDWQRTMQFFRVWNAGIPGRPYVCRFFSVAFAPQSSHFYTPYFAECAQRKGDPAWLFESDNLYSIALPDALGNCGSHSAPLYRLYNNGQGGAPNHRYTGERIVRDHMKALGWIGEGNGPDEIFACTATLRGE